MKEPLKLSLSVGVIDSVNCYGGSDGSITTSNTGGSGSKKYLWNDATKQTTSKASNLIKGTYKLVVKDTYGCSDSITADVKEPLKLLLSVGVIDSASCYGYNDGSIATLTSGGSGSYRWVWNDATKQTTSKAIKLAKGKYKIIVKDSYGCSDSAMATVDEPQQIIPKITTNRLTMMGHPLELNASITPNKKYQFNWSPSDLFFSQDFKFKPIVIFNSTTLVTLIVTDGRGCKGEDTATFTIIKPFKEIMANAFSPNGDGLNDFFGLPDVFEILEFEIFGRWGTPIFKSSSNQTSWDGTFKGNEVPIGVYVYSLKCKLKGTDQVVGHVGTITLIK
jgi:gliding motility-associated-like protein